MAQGRSPKWWSRFTPPAYDPNNPYAPDPGRGSGQKLNKLGRRMAENDPDAFLARKFSMAGIPAYRTGDPLMSNFLQEQYANADLSYRGSRMGRPGLTRYKAYNQDPTIQYLIETYGVQPPPQPMGNTTGTRPPRR